MPSYKSIWSSVAYHAVTRPAIDHAKNAISKGVRLLKRRSLQKRGIDPDRRIKILQKTRGATATNGRLWSKATISGQKRRLEAAKKARSLPRPLRSKTGKLSPQPATASRSLHTINRAKVGLVRSAPPGSVQSAVNTSTTHGQLRRKITGLAVRRATSKAGKNRAERAANIKAIRKHLGSKSIRNAIKVNKKEYSEEAARVLSKRKKP